MSQRKRKSYALDLQEEAGTIKELDVVQTKKRKANPANDHQNLSNIYQNVQNNISYAYLPPEVLLSIFYSLQIKDLIRAGSTCHSWQLVSKEESLQWFHAREFTFSEDDMAYSILSGKVPFFSDVTCELKKYSKKVIMIIQSATYSSAERNSSQMPAFQLK